MFIRQDQMEALQKHHMMRLVHQIEHRIQEMAQQIEITQITSIPAFVADGLEMGRKFGLETEEDLVFFVECQAIFGTRFERDPTDKIVNEFSRPDATAGEKVDTVRAILCFDLSEFWREVRRQ